MGHSAGGNLAVTVCMRAGETRDFRPAGLLAEYFPADLCTDPEKKKRAEGDMPAEVAKAYNAFYCDGENAIVTSAMPPTILFAMPFPELDVQFTKLPSE